MDEGWRVQDSGSLESLCSDVRIRTPVSCRKILKLLMTLFIHLWSNHHAMVSFSCIIKRRSIDTAYTRWIVIERGILHLRRSSSRIFQPIDTLC